MIYKHVFKEIRYRKYNFMLSLAALIAGVAFYVLFFTITKATRTETIRLTRDMGFNLRIIPGDTDLGQFWTDGFSNEYMPQNNAEIFKKFPGLSFAHVLGTLHEKIIWQDMPVILTGLSNEFEPSGRQKTLMSFSIKPGDVYIGHNIATRFSLHRDDFITIKKVQLHIERILTETGSTDDIRIYTELKTCQNITGRPDQINEITALQCLCLSAAEDPLTRIREQLEAVLPDCQVILNRTIAEARERQRRLGDKYFVSLLPIILIVVFMWIGVLAMLNVRERREEIGVYQALGYNSVRIAILFILRGMILAMSGAISGFALGSLLAFTVGPNLFTVTPGVTTINFILLLQALIYVPIVVLGSIMIPVSIAVTQDPAKLIGK